ncbi:MAG: D-alanine--D-alanine ligase family protein [Anaerorhabdus sp.]|uniref:D-alanine--D-alanine ligase family protein n=1 Tax=Anaerorhabdus sp. TaxID=1872524 RepID=UPI002FC6A595
MKIKVAVLFGGESVEHEVSIISAKQAMEALDTEKYEIIPIYISKSRDLYCGEELRDLTQYKDMDALLAKVPQVVLVKKNQTVTIEPVKKGLFTKAINTIDVVVPVVHGTNGEDGTLQGYLEMLKIPYAGCDVVAAAVGQDKVVMKHMFETAKLPITPWFWFYGHEFEDKKDEYLNKAKELGYPLVLKPACLGSSVGIVIAHNEEEFIEGLEEAGTFDFKIVVEKMVDNLREINCSVLGSCFSAKASVLEEVGKNDEILSYKDKYQGGGSKGAKSQGSKGMASTTRIVPAPVSEEQTKKIQELALEAFHLLGSSGVCRIDFMMNGKTDEIMINEINTIPGSLAFYLWSPVDVDFTALMDELIRIALERHRKKEKMTFSYDTNLLQNYSESGSKGAKGSKS